MERPGGYEPPITHSESDAKPPTITLDKDMFAPTSVGYHLFPEVLQGRSRPATIFNQPLVEIWPENLTGTQELHEMGLGNARAVLNMELDALMNIRGGDSIANRLKNYLDGLALTRHAQLLKELPFHSYFGKSPVSYEEEEEIIDAVEEAMSQRLNERERQLIEFKFGLVDGITHSSKNTLEHITTNGKPTQRKVFDNATLKLGRSKELKGYLSVPSESLVRKLFGAVFAKDLPPVATDSQRIVFLWGLSDSARKEIIANGIFENSSDQNPNRFNLSKILTSDLSHPMYRPLSPQTLQELEETVKALLQEPPDREATTPFEYQDTPEDIYFPSIKEDLKAMELSGGFYSMQQKEERKEKARQMGIEAQDRADGPVYEVLLADDMTTGEFDRQRLLYQAAQNVGYPIKIIAHKNPDGTEQLIAMTDSLDTQKKVREALVVIPSVIRNSIDWINNANSYEMLNIFQNQPEAESFTHEQMAGYFMKAEQRRQEQEAQTGDNMDFDQPKILTTKAVYEYLEKNGVNPVEASEILEDLTSRLTSRLATQPDLLPSTQSAVEMGNTIDSDSYPFKLVYNVLIEKGYPLRFFKDAKTRDGVPLPDALRMQTDTYDMADKISQIRDLLSLHPYFDLLDAVHDGHELFVLRAIVGTVDDRIYHSKSINRVKRDLDKDVLKRFFVTAYQNNETKQEEFSKGRFSGEEELYTLCRQQGVQPIGLATIKNLIAHMVDEVLETHPHLQL